MEEKSRSRREHVESKPDQSAREADGAHCVGLTSEVKRCLCTLGHPPMRSGSHAESGAGGHIRRDIQTQRQITDYGLHLDIQCCQLKFCQGTADRPKGAQFFESFKIVWGCLLTGANHLNIGMSFLPSVRQKFITRTFLTHSISFVSSLLLLSFPCVVV